jgi:hypothetical protein
VGKIVLTTEETIKQSGEIIGIHELFCPCRLAVIDSINNDKNMLTIKTTNDNSTEINLNHTDIIQLDQNMAKLLISGNPDIMKKEWETLKQLLVDCNEILMNYLDRHN